MEFTQHYILFIAILCMAAAVSRWWVWIEKKNDRGEAWLGKHLGVDMMRPMSVWEYLLSLLSITVGGAFFVFVSGLLQGILPYNPEGLPSLSFLQALHLAVNAATNTNWQPFAPESTYTIFTQSVALCTQSFIQGGVAIASLRALLRGLNRQDLGNAWGAIFRGSVWLHLPIWIFGTIVLLLNNVPQNPLAGSIESGPIASFTALQCITGGAGYFSQNFASVIANPTMLTNSIFLVIFVGMPIGVFLAAGRYLRWERLFDPIGFLILLLLFGISALNTPSSVDGNWDRYSTFSQSLWFHTTAGNSNGSVNASIERLHPQERIFGFLTIMGGLPFPPETGIGSNMLIFHLMLATYLASIIVGRSAIFKGYTLTVRILLIVVIALITNQISTLVASATVFLMPETFELIKTHGHYGISSLLYAISTCVQNNGSGYSLTMAYPALLWVTIVVMAIGRIIMIAPAVLIANELIKQHNRPALPQAIQLASPLFITFWILLMISGAMLAFSPLMIMGPVMEAMP